MSADKITAADLLASHRASLETMLAMNARADVDGVARFALDGLDSEARKYLRRVRGEQKRGPHGGPYSTIGAFGPNGCGRAIADIIRNSERFRALGKRQRAA